MALQKDGLIADKVRILILNFISHSAFKLNSPRGSRPPHVEVFLITFS